MAIGSVVSKCEVTKSHLNQLYNMMIAESINAPGTTDKINEMWEDVNEVKRIIQKYYLNVRNPQTNDSSPADSDEDSQLSDELKDKYKGKRYTTLAKMVDELDDNIDIEGKSRDDLIHILEDADQE